jgi:Protein of unknown function (DUF2933)
MQPIGSSKPDTARTRGRIVLVAFLLIAAFFLITEHRAHLLPYLSWAPYLLLLCCPLMMLFMHGGHNGSQPAPGSAKEKS